jgi:hypothetical protein
VPGKAAEIEREERELMQFCKSSSFSIESLALRLERAASMQDEQAKRARSI